MDASEAALLEMSHNAQPREAAVPVHSVEKFGDDHQMSLLQEEVAKLLGREHEQMCTIERLRAEANGESQQCTIVESQCKQQH